MTFRAYVAIAVFVGPLIATAVRAEGLCEKYGAALKVLTNSEKVTFQSVVSARAAQVPARACVVVAQPTTRIAVLEYHPHKNPKEAVERASNEYVRMSYPQSTPEPTLGPSGFSVVGTKEKVGMNIFVIVGHTTNMYLTLTVQQGIYSDTVAANQNADEARELLRSILAGR